MKKIKASHGVNSHGRVIKRTPSSQDIKTGRVKR